MRFQCGSQSAEHVTNQNLDPIFYPEDLSYSYFTMLGFTVKATANTNFMRHLDIISVSRQILKTSGAV